MAETSSFCHSSAILTFQENDKKLDMTYCLNQFKRTHMEHKGLVLIKGHLNSSAGCGATSGLM